MYNPYCQEKNNVELILVKIHVDGKIDCLNVVKVVQYSVDV